MMRLTPRKIWDYALPKSERINKGNTSIIYRTDDPCTLEVFTVEVVKMDWWRYGLNLISEYDEVATAYYEGYDNTGWHHSEFKRIELPVYRCLVPVLSQPDKEQRRRVRAMTNAITDIRFKLAAHNAFTRSATINEDVWLEMQNLYPLYPELESPVNFIMDWGAYDTVADTGNNDWLVWNGELIWLDPFHKEDIHKALRLNRYARR